VREEEGVKG